MARRVSASTRFVGAATPRRVGFLAAAGDNDRRRVICDTTNNNNITTPTLR